MNNTRLRPIHFILLIACILATSSPFVTAANLPSNPNVVLILVDDYGYGDISFEGNTQVATPNIDRIAYEGTHFSRFYQSAGACAPTRAALLTGRDYYETGVWGVHWGRDFIRRDENTLGNLLQSAGYRTGVFGKWHSGKTDAYFGWNRGFNTSVHTELYQYFDARVLHNNRVVSVAGPMTDVVGDQAVRFIQENQHRPFFCYIPFQAVHEPFNCPAEVFKKYKKRGYSDHVARLYGMIEVLDDNVGKVLDVLDVLNLTEDTLVLFMVDDGASPGCDLSYSNRRMNEVERAERRRAWDDPVKGGKAWIAEGGQISPFYARWPGVIPVGREVDVLSGVLDIYPTLAELCGAEFPEGQLPLRGRSLAKILKGAEPADDWNERRYFDGTNLYLIERDRAFDEGVPHIRELSVHYQQFKYIRYDEKLRSNQDLIRDELYDLENDPMEQHDLSKEKPKLTAQLREETENWFQRILDSGRAFQEAVYPVGNWSERGTPINLDSATQILGSARRDGAPGFRFTGWTEAGSGLEYNIEVLERGLYAVELNYQCDPEHLGAEFEVSTSSASAVGHLENPEKAVMGPLELEKGVQTLRVELKDLNGKTQAMEWLDFLVVHRIPETDCSMPSQLGFEIRSVQDANHCIRAEFRNEAREFMRDTGVDTFEVTAGELLTVDVYSDKLESVTSIDAYLGFDPVAVGQPATEPFTVRANAVGRQTLNLVFHLKGGHTHSARVDLLVSPIR